MPEMIQGQNKMGIMPIPKLLATMSLPAIFSMLVQSLYNIVDSIFVAQVSESALLAVTVAFPMQMLILAIGLGVGIGTNSIVARRLGEGKKVDADQYAQTGLFLSMCASLLVLVLGTFVPKLFVQGFTTDPAAIKYGTDYLMICMICSFGMMIELTVSKSLQATGNMIIPMVSQLIGALTNIVLDALFIFGFKMEVVGAALATVIGQITAMTYALIMAKRKSHIIQIFFKKFRLKLSYVLTIFKVGAPAMVMNAVAGFITIIMNSILRGYSEQAITVLGVYFKLQSFVFMPVFGLTQGALPILAFNYGANNKKRFNHTLLYSGVVALVIMVLGTLLFQLAPELMMKMFNSDATLTGMGVVALRAISWSFVFAALGIVATTAYQAVGYGFTSLIMSVLRQVVLIIPAAIIFGKLWGLNYLWYCYPFAEVITVLIFLPLLFVLVKRAFKKKEKALYLESPVTTDGLSGEEVVLEKVSVEDTPCEIDIKAEETVLKK